MVYIDSGAFHVLFLSFSTIPTLRGPQKDGSDTRPSSRKKNQSEDYNKTVELLCLFVVVLCSNK